MKVCILGITGLLGQALVQEAVRRKYDVLGIARKTTKYTSLDVTNDTALVDFFLQNHFDLVINTIAIVNLSACEQDKERAYLVNARVSSILNELSYTLGFKHVYISTDNYFTGDKNKKHGENAKIALLNEYARTKYIGECFTLLNEQSLIVRTNIVGFKNSDSEKTFVEWVISSLSTGMPMTLFDDYYTSSISVNQFSKSIFDLIEKNTSGLVNLASREVFSKAEFIEVLAKELELSLANTTLGKVEALNTKRAESLGLDVQKAESILKYKLPTLHEVIMELKNEYNTFFK